MPKASPVRNVFQGELSELALGRTDIDRYAKSMRYMSNFVASRIGPAIRRSGTTFEGTVYDEDKKSVLRPFIFNELEAAVLEFAEGKLRFWYEYTGVAANREVTPTIQITGSPLKLTIPGHDFVVGEHVTFDNFQSPWGVNGVVMRVDIVSGNDVTFNQNASPGINGAIPGSPVAAVVYELNTPYQEVDLDNIRVVQWLDIVYVFCKGYPQYLLKRFDTFDWTLTPMPPDDGPYLDVNTTTTRLIPTSKGTWMQDMTSDVLPSPQVAAADSEAVGHEAWKAFDGDLTSFWEGTTAQTGWLEFAFTDPSILNNLIPVMTGAVTAGVTMSATSELGGNEAWRAGDTDSHSDWFSTGSVPQEIRFQLAIPGDFLQYNVRASRRRRDNIPKDWTIDSSPDGVVWTTRATEIGESFETGQKKTYFKTASGNWEFWRMRVTKVSRHYYTTVIPAVGKPGQPGYVKKKTVTTLSDARVAIARIEALAVSYAARIVNGYTIHIGMKNSDDAASAKEHAPDTWTLEGWDGASWYVLDVRRDYDEWGSNRSSFFDIKNNNPYLKYRLNIQSLKKNGSTIMPRIGKLVFASPDAPDIAFSASGLAGINDDRGFQPTDVGRVMRVRDADGFWRWGVITSVADPVHATFNPTGKEPLILPKQVTDWRLGIWSGTTGYPTCGTFFEERLWVAGMERYPDTIVASRTGRFTDYTQSTRRDEVLDDHAMVLRCASKRMSRIHWLSSDENSVIAGTGTGEFIFTSPNNEPFTARNSAARPITNKGSAPVEGVRVDSETMMVQRSRRAVYAVGARAPTQSDSSSAYVATSVTLLGSHLAFPLLQEIVYQAEPHSILWGRREDGSIVSMTYDKVNDVLGGQRHDFGGTVESICVIPSSVDCEDTLYIAIRRNMNGLNRRYIERVTRYWDFGLDLVQDGIFLDCSMRKFEPPASTQVVGLRHLAQEVVDVMADGVLYRDLTVTLNGVLTLPVAAQYVLVGKRYISEGEITGLEEGAADGTSQGKAKRPNVASIRLWDSYGGDLGRWNEDTNEAEWTPVEYALPTLELEPATLRTVITQATVLPMGYGNVGAVRFRQTDPYPFNVVALYPQTTVNDR